jgi:hypothetical protein
VDLVSTELAMDRERGYNLSTHFVNATYKPKSYRGEDTKPECHQHSPMNVTNET